MSFSMPLAEFSRLKLTASIKPNGDTAITFVPSPTPLGSQVATPDITVHFSSTYTDSKSEISVHFSASPSSSSLAQTSSHVAISEDTLDSKCFQPRLELFILTKQSLPAEASITVADQADHSYITVQEHPGPLTSDAISSWLEQIRFDPEDPTLLPLVDKELSDGTAACRSIDISQFNTQFSRENKGSTVTRELDVTMTEWPNATLQQPALSSRSIPSPESSSSSVSIPHGYRDDNTSANATQLDFRASDRLGSAWSHDIHATCMHQASGRISSTQQYRHGTVSPSKRSQSTSYPTPSHRSKPSPYPCTFDGCLEVFSRKHDRMRHEVAQHGLQCKWVCKKCSRFFGSQKTLAKHICRDSNDRRWTAFSDNQSTGDIPSGQ
ncbi:hypothetical protein GYMLUDRAFT_61944 [Collybiopsis luxurians FD-317 M1]|uniref:C2H2-type domain-containing protein n=1 Tax=Collybiopsis luxurians FD-317 M1 TaxID=944289 RepID=A0A0D0CER7_9AGAR|nr:hypothetical protein GYMLUDRAFT_61944 [Collybiopsis luxurians FD-317 M1]